MNFDYLTKSLMQLEYYGLYGYIQQYPLLIIFNEQIILRYSACLTRLIINMELFEFFKFLVFACSKWFEKSFDNLCTVL